MKKSPKLDPLAERPDVDFSKGVRGRYFNQLPKGINLAVIDHNLHDHFPDSESMNRALRTILTIREPLQTAFPSSADSNSSPTT